MYSATALRRYGYGTTSATCYQVPPYTYHTRPYNRTQYQCYVSPYITYVVRTRSACYVLPLAEPLDISCLQGADASATGFSEKACQYPSLVIGRLQLVETNAMCLKVKKHSNKI